MNLYTHDTSVLEYNYPFIAYVRQCTELGCISSGVVLVNDRPRLIVDEINIAHTHHISMLSAYTVDPSKTSGGRYLSVCVGGGGDSLSSILEAA